MLTELLALFHLSRVLGHAPLLINVSRLCHQVCSQEDIDVISRRAVFNLLSPFFSLISFFPGQY